MISIENDLKNIELKIHFIHGQKVMLDHDLAELYQVQLGVAEENHL